MSYEAECPCGARLQVGDHAEGKRIKCPRCGELISIPRADEPEEAIPVVSLGENPPEKGEDRNPCPYCAEMVLSHAKICPCCQSPLGTGPETPCPKLSFQAPFRVTFSGPFFVVPCPNTATHAAF